MRILALETSSLTGSLAVLDDDRVQGQTQLDPQQRTAQSFAPAIVRQLAEVGWRSQDLQLIAVTVGPGSFTGLRIGVTVAKTLAYAVGAQVVGLNTLQVIAAQTPAGIADVWAVLNAQRQQLFAGRYQRHESLWETVRDAEIVDNETWLQSLAAGLAVTGWGLAKLRDQLPTGIILVDEANWAPRAATVGRLGYIAYQSGRRDDLWGLCPQYYRKCAAEEVWESKKSSG
ncbi:MAG: tRNA (adenosine(37)-N6)-threonylcarbamoyltransferase complex dimerization subunit type 1 TsaB [Planctomycetota bacterium]|nr:tRNA (adenosine(37)-N6)-threonylcarbamoyltransferase complex dimerization subunit type 1 TsaB [Planctomycetota bacterium]